MSKEIEKDKPDIIHTIGLRSYQSIIAWRVSKKLGIPLVVSDQGGLTTHPFLNESGLFLKILYKIQKIVIKKILPLSITYDHRSVDGATASKFMLSVMKSLESY